MPNPIGISSLLRELRADGIADLRVLKALENVPREKFVPEEYRQHAYRNIPLPIGCGQTISQPFVVALMTQALELRQTDRVLEIGTGSGYQAAVLAELAGEVLSIERIPELAGAAGAVLESLGYRNVRVLLGDGSAGCLEEAPFDAIMVTAASPRTPDELLDQLAEGGRLVLPVGSLFSQELLLHTKRCGGITESRLGQVRFVPLVGAMGWSVAQARAFLEEG